MSDNAYVPHPLLSDSPRMDYGSAVVSARLHVSELVVAIGGERDGSNAAMVSDYLYRLPSHGHGLIVDLTEVGFLSVQALRALMVLGEECAKTVLRLVRRDNAPPITASVAEAVVGTTSPGTGDGNGRPF